MWRIENETPFAAERGWTRDRNGVEVWLVVVKCTFDIKADGTTVIANDQPEVRRIPEYHGEPGKSSIKYDVDLVPGKTTTDVTVLGDACAPEGRPVTELEVGFRVGPVSKLLHVSGDRAWHSSAVTRAEPFVRMPLVYERAYGGIDRLSKQRDRDFDWRNPVGTGFAMSRDSATGVRLPNIEYPHARITRWSDRPAPAGFGPIAREWQPRVALAGTYDDAWQRDRQPLVPEDFDDRFFQSAPQDQQTPAFLRGGEPVVLDGLSAGGTVRFFLPKVFLSFETEFVGGRRERHTDRKLHSVILEPNGPRVSLVWHSALPCHRDVHRLDCTTITVKDLLDNRHGRDADPTELELV